MIVAYIFFLGDGRSLSSSCSKNNDPELTDEKLVLMWWSATKKKRTWMVTNTIAARAMMRGSGAMILFMPLSPSMSFCLSRLFVSDFKHR